VRLVLHVHRAERADGLVDALRALLLAPPPDPFTPEVIAVPTRGMERWLSQRMSVTLGASAGRSDGICANVAFPSPRRLIADAVAAASGVMPDADPWLPERMVWSLLEVLDECLREPWLHGLAAYLGQTSDPPDPVRQARRFSIVRHVAELFDRYALHRPEMVTAWAAGSDGDGSGHPVRASARWQPELWRRLQARIALPGPAERLDSACAALCADRSAIDLPERMSMFGLTRLPAGHLRVLRALAATRDVHLFLLHPSPGMWDALASAPAIVRRRDDTTAELPANQLLASWGRDAREMQLLLTAGGEHADHHHRLEFRATTLLSRIQAEVRGDRPPPGPPLPGQVDARAVLDPEDRSLQIHACHGRARQVEVVRDAILQLLEDDPTLEPRDVIVMCPDVDTLAPLIQATFGAGEVSPDQDGAAGEPRAAVDPQAGGEPGTVDLRVSLADRPLRQPNPLLGVVAQLLELTHQRMTATEVLDLADREPVRRRFRLDDDDITRLQSWITDAGIRWGLDAAHRAPFKLDGLPSGTWRAGIDRVLLGVAMTEDGQRLFEDVLPLDDVDSGSIDLAGRFAELIARVEQAVDALGSRQTIDAWAQAIGTAADALTRTREREAWQRAELQRVLDEMVGEATLEDATAASALTLPEVRALLASRLEGRPTRANFRTGHLTVCTLHPMRSVPHRVVCLLGLDDGAFPRKGFRDGDDLMLDDPHIGERDPRAEDRQLLLDALLAATERLLITYTGNDERTNAERPPAVPVGELLDIVDATARGQSAPARAQVVVRHPLQPFDRKNFERGALVPARHWSFDRVMLDGARALSGPRSRPGPFLDGPLPPLDPSVVELEDLVRFVQHPVRAFLRQRLRISLSDVPDELEDALRVELDPLQRWAVGQRLLEARLAGVDGRTAILAEIARGTLPPGVLGEPVIHDVYPIVNAIVAAAGELVELTGERTSADVRVVLERGRVLSGSVPVIGSDVLLSTTYSRLSPRHRLVSWVRLLALAAADPARAPASLSVGRGPGSGTVTIARIEPLAEPAPERSRLAREHLETLLDLYDRGMCEPLPLYCMSSAAYAAAAAEGADAIAAARGAWTSEWAFDKEDRELEHQLVLGGERSFDELLAEPPRDDERGPGWDTEERTRFGRLARRLWSGLLAREQVSTR